MDNTYQPTIYYHLYLINSKAQQCVYGEKGDINENRYIIKRMVSSKELLLSIYTCNAKMTFCHV